LLYQTISFMKTHEITIQSNNFNAIQIPTTQEDNSGHITNRWELFYKFDKETNGSETAFPVGHLVRYFDKSYAVFHAHAIIYRFNFEDVIVTQYR